MKTDIQSLLVVMTTYPGNFEHRMILHKVLKHFRWRNGWDVKLAVFSDGRLNDSVVSKYANFVVDRDGPIGVCEGELESVRQLAAFAKNHGFQYIMKSAGDIIMNRDHWVEKVFHFYQTTSSRFLSTHWHENNSWIVGTKFFVCDTDFLLQTWPDSNFKHDVEGIFTESIAKNYKLEEVLYLINSNTGEADEVEAELKDWRWEHGHRLSKFKQLDGCTPALTRLLHKAFLYQWLRVRRDIKRSLARLKIDIR